VAETKTDAMWAKFPVQAATSPPGLHFFGYYDKFPWDATGRYVLALEPRFMDREPDGTDEAGIGIVDLEHGNRWEPLARTRAWNFQQGTMLQWLGSAADRVIIYNAIDGDRFVSVTRNVFTGEMHQLPMPVYAVSRDGRQAVTLNFARVHRTRPGYGYPGLPDPHKHDPHPDEDGIYWMDLETGEHRLIINLDQMARMDPRPTMEGAEHWFNHLQFNNDGTRFIFLHRWQAEGQPRGHRMYTANPDGTGIHRVVDGLISHFDWRDPAHIIGWAGAEDFSDCAFRLFTDETDDSEILGEGILTQDGHCSYSPDKQWVLNDTYPDQDEMRTLMLYHPGRNERIDVGRFLSPKEYSGPIRCDLHPRWNRDGTRVCWDSIHEGHRQMYIMDVSEVTQA